MKNALKGNENYFELAGGSSSVARVRVIGSQLYLSKANAEHQIVACRWGLYGKANRTS